MNILKCAALGALTAALPLHAAEINLPEIQINGFATVAGSATNTDDVLYKGTGKDISFDTDSKAALQLSIPINKDFSYTMQLISKAENDYKVEAEWAFASYQPNNLLEIRAGRLRIPFFRISETLEVGYSYPWVRPPIDTYGQFAFSRFSGIDSIITVPIADSELKIHPHFGTSASSFEMMGMEGEFSVKNLVGINFTWSLDWMNLRFGHTEGDYDVHKFDSLEPLADIMYAFSGDRDTANQFAITGRHGQFTGFGIDLERYNFMFLAEYNIRKTDGLMADNTSWYATLGYRFGNFLPHLTFSEYKTDEDYSNAKATIPNISTGDADIDAQLQGAYTQIINFNSVNQQSITAGLRWDFMPKTALKIEWQRFMPEEESSLLSPPFTGPQAIYAGQDLDDVDLYTVAIDFIF